MAAELGLHEHIVGKWRRRFLKESCDGLLDEARLGRPRTINDDQVAEVIERTLRTMPRDATHWSIAALLQTGWLIESITTQILVIFLIRSRRMPWTMPVATAHSEFVVRTCNGSCASFPVGARTQGL
ncbi:transposase [Bradyrhizobium sp. LA8.1]